MPKFKMHVKISGFEVSVEGERADLPQIAGNIGQQLTKLLEPTAKIVEGQLGLPLRSGSEGVDPKGLPDAVPKKRTRRNAITAGNAEAIDWKHDPAKWGAPSQDWSTADKAVWLLHVVSAEANQAELPGGVIEKTFNKHFRQAGAIRSSHINRDLGKLKSSTPAEVGEDTREGSKWFLTAAGIERAKRLQAGLAKS